VRVGCSGGRPGGRHHRPGAAGTIGTADRSPGLVEFGSPGRDDHCTAAGVPVIRLHDTRHTTATRMLYSGTSVSATAKWLGHDPAMTLRVYGHVYDDALASAGDVLFGTMSPANGER